MREKNEFVFFQQSRKWGKVNQMWVLFDSQSTIDVFLNTDLLKNNQKSDRPIRIHSQVGMLVVNEIGDFGPIKYVWLDRNGITNILSLPKMLDWEYKVKFDSMKGNHFMVDPGNGKLIMFDLSSVGVYYYKITEDPWYTFIETVSDKMEEFTPSQIKKAKGAKSV